MTPNREAPETALATDEVYAWVWTLFGNGWVWQRRLTFTKDDPFAFEVSISPNGFISVPVPLTLARLSAAERRAPDAVAVTPEMVSAALFAKVPGGAEVWHWLPQTAGNTPHQTAHNVMRCAIAAALAPSAPEDRKP